MKKEKAKAKKPKSNITLHISQEHNPIVKDFFFIYQYSNDTPCHFQIDSKYYCYYLSLRYHENYPLYISSTLHNTLNQTNSKPRFLFLLFDYIFPKEESSLEVFLKSPSFEINSNLFNANAPSDFLSIKDKGFACPSIHEEKVEKMLLDINMLCIEMNVCFILCFSGKDVAQYIYLLSMLDNDDYNASKRNLNISSNNNDQLIEAICYIDLIKNKDAHNILSHCKDITNIGLAKRSTLESIPKLNEAKINAIQEFFNYDFSLLNKQ